VQHYYHRQTNLVPLGFLAGTALIAILAWITFAPAKIPVVVVIVPIVFAAIAAVIFTTMTVEVTDSEFTFAFGLGVMRRRIPRADIVRVEHSMTPWWYATGVKINPTYITYMVAAGPAVAITLAKGMAIRIGTDDADGLLRALAPHSA
jgi:hypothetical protein